MNAYFLVDAGLAMVLCSAAAVDDLRRGRISNWLTGSAVLIGLAVGAYAGGWFGLADSAGGIFLAGLVPFLLFKMGAMGGGDVKLFAALGAVLGGSAALEIQVVSFCIGALFGICLWLKTGMLLDRLRAVVRIGRTGGASARRSEESVTHILFGPVIWAGALVVIAINGIAESGL